jgi:hypothetical protein
MYQAYPLFKRNRAYSATDNSSRREECRAGKYDA